MSNHMIKIDLYKVSVLCVLSKCARETDECNEVFASVVGDPYVLCYWISW